MQYGPSPTTTVLPVVGYGEFAFAFEISRKLPTSNESKATAKHVKNHDETLQSHFMRRPPLE
jgi:hypothetical protein